MRRSVAGSESWSAKRSRGREGGPKPPAHCGSGRCRAAATEFLLALRGIHRAACRRAKNELIEENAAALARIRVKLCAASTAHARLMVGPSTLCGGPRRCQAERKRGGRRMDIQETLKGAYDAMTVQRV